MDEKLYFAYGSNINLVQMAYRCPAAVAAGPAVLDGYELLFRGNAGGCGVATIKPCEGARVYGLLWKLTPACEKALDRYEGYPHLYKKEQLTVRTAAGENLSVMAYVMENERCREPVLPTQQYFNGILDGYRENSLPAENLYLALRRACAARPRQQKKSKEYGER